MTKHQDDPRDLETLDRDLSRYSFLATATQTASRPLLSLGVSAVFITLAGVIALMFFGDQPNSMIVVVAAGLGAYMALNIGANDVANNMGPAVGANALSLGAAIAIAAVFETAGALIAGGDVVSTIAKGIIAPESMGNATTFIWAMLSALMAAALWVNIATWVGA
ncbi:MAG: inorganic phosphate transporter, partial [Pseudomonadota bacterium]